MKNVVFKGESLSEIFYWAHSDKNIFDRIFDLLKDINRNGAAKGIGKPEKLKRRKDCWSRRITEEHRLVYKVDAENIYVLSCRGHYDE